MKKSTSIIILVSVILLVIVAVSFALLSQDNSLTEEQKVMNMAVAYIEENYGTDYVLNGEVANHSVTEHTQEGDTVYSYPAASFRVPADYQQSGILVNVMVDPETGEIAKVYTQGSKSMPPPSPPDAPTEPEEPESTPPEKVLAVLKEVVGLDIAKYSTDLELYTQAPFLYFEVLPQEDIRYILESNESNLRVSSAFVTGKLRSIRIRVNDGSPLTTKPATNPLEMAKDFLNKYKTISSASYYGTFVSMLDNVEANKNVTKTAENVKLEVTITASYTSFRWKYSFNGVEAPSKCVALKFENGFLKYFIDNWSLWSIGSTDLNISEEEAIEIAMNAAENHSWNVGMGGDNQVTVTEFNIVGVSETKLSFGNYPTKNESRGGDPLTLYPGWRVKLYFDKLYPGYVYGLDIAIWADTGEVNDTRTLISGLPNNIP